MGDSEICPKKDTNTLVGEHHEDPANNSFGSSRSETQDVSKPPEDIEGGATDSQAQKGGNGSYGDENNGANAIQIASDLEEDESPQESQQMQSLEIDLNRGDGNTDESFEEDGDMEHLLGGSNDDPDKATQQKRHPLCARPKKIGNMRVFLPVLFEKTGWGIAGPHWFGPFCVLFLIGLASHYFIGISIRRIGPITTSICIIFACACAYNLANVAYRDPGVVKLQPGSQRPQDTDEDQRLQFRWCDRCQVFQPVDGAHCSDCNVCVAGFDQ